MVLVVSLSPVDLLMVSLVQSHRQPIDEALAPCQCLLLDVNTAFLCHTHCAINKRFMMNGTLKSAVNVNCH